MRNVQLHSNQKRDGIRSLRSKCRRDSWNQKYIECRSCCWVDHPKSSLDCTRHKSDTRHSCGCCSTCGRKMFQHRNHFAGRSSEHTVPDGTSLHSSIDELDHPRRNTRNWYNPRSLYTYRSADSSPLPSNLRSKRRPITNARAHFLCSSSHPSWLPSWRGTLLACAYQDIASLLLICLRLASRTRRAPSTRRRA